ncbi:MAG: hypothetical protein QXJ20_02410 [Candidatus Aenigmatarchaeota archaeon]
MIFMGGRSIAHRAASYRARRAMLKYKMSDIFKEKIRKEYPNCVGTFSDCPEAIANPDEPPEQCKKCPIFVESKYYEKQANKETLEKAKELAQLFQELRNKAI